MGDFPQRLSIQWLKNAYRSGEVTPFEVAEEIVRREELYREYHVWIVPPTMELMKPYLQALPEDKEALPLWGIPFAIKDNIDLEGISTTAGCPDYAYLPRESATVVKRLIQAGAFPVGKTNMDQFATGLVGTRSPYGETWNALNPELISGGSSSGSAVAVALGMAAFSLGTDTAGSGRVPALLNGLVGLKPAIGAWSTKGVVPACASLDCVTVFTDSLQDARRVDQVERGVDRECCYSRDLPLQESERPKKILLPEKEPEFYGSYGEIYRGKWKRALERIDSLEIPVEYIDSTVFSQAAAILYDGPWVAERWADLGNFVDSHQGSMFPVTEKVLRSAEGMRADSVFQAMHRLACYKAKVREMLSGNVLVMPTAGGTFTREQVRKNPIETNTKMGFYTNHCNLLDLAAVALPEKKDDVQFPFGITMFTEFDQENILYGAARLFLDSKRCGKMQTQ